MEPRRIVVGIDFSAPSLATAHWVAHQLAPEATLVLTHIVPSSAGPRFYRDALPTRAALIRRAGAAARDSLGVLAARLGASRCVIHVGSGEPGEWLARLAAERQGDLIVIGRAGQAQGRARQLGTTAERLLRHSTVPVLLAAGPLSAPPRRILVALDEARLGQEALAWSRLIGSGADRWVTALHVLCDRMVEYVATETAWSVGHVPTDRSDDRLREAADRWLRSRLASAGLDASRVTIAVGVGDPRAEILAAADCFDADLLIVGRNGAHAGSGNALGSVARRVLRPTGRPVLVIPEPGRLALARPSSGARRLTLLTGSGRAVGTTRRADAPRSIRLLAPLRARRTESGARVSRHDGD